MAEIPKIKLHLGCGKRYIPGFIHIDAVDFSHVDHVSNIDDLSMFKENEIDLIYCCHVLEHFKRNKVISVLQEWRRVLKEEGILRISVPDFEVLCRIYFHTKDINDIIGPIIGKQNYLYNFHYNIFDFISLRNALMKSGFKKVYRYDWRETEHCTVDDFSQAYFPHMKKERGVLISVNVEAVK